MIKSEQINELAAALTKAQAKITSANKDSKAHAYKYADLGTVIEAVKPSLNENGISFLQLIEESDPGTVRVTTLLLHSSGQYIGSTGSTGIPEMRGCNLAQSSGAAQSYLKRYQLQALTGLPTEDNDASSEGFKKETAYSAPAVSSKPSVVAAPPAAKPTTVTVSESSTPATVNGKSSDFSARARQLRRPNGESTPERNESF